MHSLAVRLTSSINSFELLVSFSQSTVVVIVITTIVQDAYPYSKLSRVTHILSHTRCIIAFEQFKSFAHQMHHSIDVAQTLFSLLEVARLWMLRGNVHKRRDTEGN